MTPATTYYVRAFATNQSGTTFGNEISFFRNIEIGDFYLGGTVAYILQSGDSGYDSNVPHGLIVSPFDQGIAQWGCQGTSTFAGGIAVGTGNQNTINITNGCATSGIAARLCYDLVLNGYSDWYLPSKNELSKFYLNKDIIGGFARSYYWSSTEDNNDLAWIQDFNTGSQDYTNKNWIAPIVRAVRSF